MHSHHKNAEPIGATGVGSWSKVTTSMRSAKRTGVSVFFSTKKTKGSGRLTVSSVRSAYEEKLNWRGYLDPRLIEAKELSAPSDVDAQLAVGAAQNGEAVPTTESRRIALELEQLELEIHKLTRRWTPRLDYYVKDPT